MAQPDLPDLTGKLYYTIGEVAEICGVKPHVLRYWESEFPTLRPRKDRAGSRRYRRRDVEEVLAIRALLHEEGFRIAGARKLLQQRRQQGQESGGPPAPGQLMIPFAELDRDQQLAHLRTELSEILVQLQQLRPARRLAAEG
jgi:DNA-binding transcriptional MerR regulator